MINHIVAIKNWFTLAVPTPTDKNRAVQIGVHFEEVAEMAVALFPGDSEIARLLDAKAAYFKRDYPGVFDGHDRTELLDALCDQIVTAVGVAHMFGLDIDGALAEVNRSNWSKFVDCKPVFDANGKITKPATYSPPDLSSFV